MSALQVGKSTKSMFIDATNLLRVGCYKDVLYYQLLSIILFCLAKFPLGSTLVEGSEFDDSVVAENFPVKHFLHDCHKFTETLQ